MTTVGTQRSRGRDGHTAKVETEVDALQDLARPDLAARWERTIGTPAPRGISMRLMVLAVAYSMQAKANGGLKTSLRRRLENPSEDGGPIRQKAEKTISPGTRLVREWNGVAHAVDVTEDGYLWNDHHHRSLSAIARAITGARWSGPRFFGLRDRQSS
jgi:hypothetical protein